MLEERKPMPHDPLLRRVGPAWLVQEAEASLLDQVRSMRRVKWLNALTMHLLETRLQQFPDDVEDIDKQ